MIVHADPPDGYASVAMTDLFYLLGHRDADVPPPSPDRPTVGSIRIIRLLLDGAATVEEAVQLMRRHHVDFSGGPQVHYLIADAAGRSVVVEYADGVLNVVKSRILTNIALTGSIIADRMADRRYRLLTEGAAAGADPLELLRTVAQPHTRWSIVYTPRTASAQLVTSQQWDRVHPVSLAAPG